MSDTNNSKDNVKPSSDGMNFRELILNVKAWFRYLLSKWVIIVLTGIIGGSLGIVYAKLTKPVYTATTTFVLESGDTPGGGLGQYAGMAAMMGIDLGGTGGGIFQGDNLLELYKSRKMIEAALLGISSSDSSKLMIDRYLELNKERELWKSKSPNLLNIDFRIENPKTLKRERDSVLQSVVLRINKNNLVVAKPDKKLSIIKVDVMSHNEVFSKEFNETLVSEVNNFYIQTKTKKSLDNIAILQHKTDSVRSIMNSSISVAASVIDATPNLNPTRQAQRLVPTQRSQFSAETNKAILGQLVQNLEMSKMALLKEAPLIQKVDEPIFPLKKKKIGIIKAFIISAFLFVFFTIVMVIGRKLYREILNN